MKSLHLIGAIALVSGLTVFGMARTASPPPPTKRAISAAPAAPSLGSDTAVFLAVHPDLNDPHAAAMRLVTGSPVLDNHLVIGGENGAPADEILARAFPLGAIERLTTKRGGGQTVLGSAAREALARLVQRSWTESSLPQAITKSEHLDQLFANPTSYNDALHKTIITIDPEFQLFQSSNDATVRVLATVVWLRVFVVTPNAESPGAQPRRFAELMYADRVESWVPLNSGTAASPSQGLRISEPEELIRKALDRALDRGLASLRQSPLVTRLNNSGSLVIDTSYRESFESRSMTMQQAELEQPEEHDATSDQ